MSLPIKITEQFYTIQGEGPSSGKPAYFIRLAGCNLWCSWCDSLHSVDPKLFHGKTTDIDYNQIPRNCPIVVITGGEPCLFDLMLIRDRLIPILPNLRIEIESNATVFPEFDLSLFHWNLSPKLASSKQKTPQQDELRLKNLNHWVQFANQHPKNAIFKFVVQNSGDLDEIVLLQNEFKIPASQIYLMPEGQTPESQTGSLAEAVVQFVKTNQYNFTPRLHVLLWGNKRGV